jgi:hypothetical protein
VSFIKAVQNVGGASVPQDIRRLRRSNLETCKRLGQPVIFRHMWNLKDEVAGKAQRCPVCFDAAYEQVRNDCMACFGVGYVSTTAYAGHYYDKLGNFTTSNTTGLSAFKWGGFDKPYLTWLIEPDVAVDVFKINDQGVMVQTYDATGVAPWFPKLGDNDLCINVVLDRSANVIQSLGDRFQLKITQQVTMRGFGTMNAARLDQPFLISQTFQMAKLPDVSTNILNLVPASDFIA